jgi:hypothetical protein
VVGRVCVEGRRGHEKVHGESLVFSMIARIKIGRERERGGGGGRSGRRSREMRHSGGGRGGGGRGVAYAKPMPTR